MRRNSKWIAWAVAALALPMIQAQENIPLPKAQDLRSTGNPQISGKRLWQASLVTLSVANVVDVHSSLGKRELNSALAGSSGTFGTRGILLKSGMQGGLLGVEYLILRRHSHDLAYNPARSKLYRTLAIINFASAAALTGVAAHNYTVARAHP